MLFLRLRILGKLPTEIISYEESKGVAMYPFAKVIVNFFFKILAKITVYDKQHLPKEGGYIIACTHTGWVDIIQLGLAIYPIRIHFMAKKELFQFAPIRWLLTSLNAFPVDRKNPGPSSIKIPRKLIKEGKVVGIFPSGTRTQEDVPLKRGAVTIASYAKAPIVPAAYEGPNNFKELFQRRKKAKIIFGAPLYLDETLSKKEALDKLAKELDSALKHLKQKLVDENE